MKFKVGDKVTLVIDDKTVYLDPEAIFKKPLAIIELGGIGGKDCYLENGRWYDYGILKLAEEEQCEKISTKIVKVAHVNINITPNDYSYCWGLKIKNTDRYYFKTLDNVKVNDLIICDTTYGATVGKITQVYETLEEILKVKDLPALNNLKYCISMGTLPDELLLCKSKH